MATCRECKLFDLDACKDKAGRVLKNRVGRCLWKFRGAVPLSVMAVANVSASMKMHPDDGARCPCFVKREPSK